MTTSAQLSGVTPNLMVKDVNATVEYYTRTLGFQVLMTVPDSGKLNWAMLKRDGAVLMFQERENLCAEYPTLRGNAPGGGLSLFVGVSDVEALFRELDGKVTVCSPLHDTFYGTREFAVLDVDGFVLTFAER